ncbi:MAG: hypothetical protein ACYTG1_12410, partial [Planctomycetota bacterium]
MITRCSGVLCLILTLAAVAAFVPAAPATAAPAPGETQDVITMADGRVLEGKILDETRDLVIFELVHRKLNTRTKMTLRKDDILEIKRDVPVEDAGGDEAEADAAPAAGAAAPSGGSGMSAEPRRRHGVGQTDSADAPTFYLLPVKGQMGTDVHVEVYEDLVEDIRAHDPDYLIIKLECRDYEDRLYSRIGREEAGLADFDDYRAVVNLFHDDLRQYRQVLWVHDSVGISSMLALAWEELYMHPDARFGGLAIVRGQTGFDSWKDDDVRGKMTAAFMAMVKGFLEYGGYSHELADAMIRPQYTLSASFKGRSVDWALDGAGEFVVDGSDQRTLSFTAKTAE